MKLLLALISVNKVLVSVLTSLVLNEVISRVSPLEKVDSPLKLKVRMPNFSFRKEESERPET